MRRFTRSTHQRAVLDLFDRRMAFVVREGKVPNEVATDFSRVTDRVELLFGPEVKSYLDEIYPVTAPWT